MLLLKAEGLGTTQWASLEEVLDVARERPIVAAYISTISTRFIHLSEFAESRITEDTAPSVRNACRTIRGRCVEFSEEIRRVAPNAGFQALSEDEEHEILNALPQYPQIRHLMANLLTTVEMMATNAMIMTKDHEKRLRMALRVIVTASRELHGALGLYY